MILEPIIEFMAAYGVDLEGVPAIVIAAGIVLVLIVGLRLLNRLADALVQLGCVVLTVVIIVVIAYELLNL